MTLFCDCPGLVINPVLKKLISAAGFRLKGQGWYETDLNLAQNAILADSGTSTGPCCRTTCGDRGASLNF